MAGLAALREEAARANRILANEGVLDAFGHVSMRHPAIRNAICCRARARRNWSSPATCWNTISIPSRCAPTNERLYSERVIHGEIYKARPDVTRSCTIMRRRSCRSASPARN